MKIRNGFVSNSSATSFFFILKSEDIEDMYAAMRNHAEKFEITYNRYDGEEICINVEDVINAIKEAYSKKPKTFAYPEGRPVIGTIFDAISDMEQGIETYEHAVKEWNQDEYYKNLVKMYKDKLNILRNSISDGFKNSVCIDFGDNHGDISGDPLAYAMDYVGRDIVIISEDLIVFTDQNR